MHELLFICISVSEISLNLGFGTFYLLRDNYLMFFFSFLFFSSIVLMCAHGFSAFVELGLFDFYFLCANTIFM